eukprot:5246922-Prymnesium_polylepis.4
MLYFVSLGTLILKQPPAASVQLENHPGAPVVTLTFEQSCGNGYGGVVPLARKGARSAVSLRNTEKGRFDSYRAIAYGATLVRAGLAWINARSSRALTGGRSSASPACLMRSRKKRWNCGGIASRGIPHTDDEGAAPRQ